VDTSIYRPSNPSNIEAEQSDIAFKLFAMNTPWNSTTSIRNELSMAVCMNASMMKEVKELRVENARLKKCMLKKRLITLRLFRRLLRESYKAISS